MKRAECQGCPIEDKATLCAVLDLAWAWYELLKTIPLLNLVAREPEPCWMKEDASCKSCTGGLDWLTAGSCSRDARIICMCVEEGDLWQRLDRLTENYC